MTFASFDTMPPWAMPVGLAVHLVAGIGFGIVYFHSVWWSARLFALGGRVPTTIAVMTGRIALLGGVLTLASLEGALPLLVTALGVLIARAGVVRKFRQVAP